MALNQLLNDNVETPENMVLWRELVIEANTQLGLFTLPEEFFGKYKNLIKITAYENAKKIMGEDPRLAW